MSTSVLAVVLFSCCFAHVAFADTNIYVNAVTGNDAQSGASPGDAVLTIPRAQSLARAAPRTAPINVWLNGTFRLTSRLEFTTADSGTADAMVTYAAVPGAAASISGGRVVTGFKPSPSKKGVWEAPVTVGTDTPYFRQVWVDGHRHFQARTPVMAYESATDSGIQYKDGQLPTTTPANPNDTHVVLYESWTASLHRIAAINGAARTINFTTHFNNQWSGGAAGSRYYLENWKEVLDEPGEFYLDRTTSTLSLMPSTAVSPTTEVVVPQVLELVVLTGNSTTGERLQYLRLANVTLEHAAVETDSCFTSGCDAQSAAFLTTAAVYVAYASGVELVDVAVRHVGGYGVWVDTATTDVRLERSHVYDVGAGAVRVGPAQGGVQPTTSLLNRGTAVNNCLLEDGGHVYQEGCGVLVGMAQGTNVTHNTIRHMKYTGVSVGWTWTYENTSVRDVLVGHNHIQDIGQSLLSDMGAVYVLGLQPGSHVVNNLCEGVYSYNYGGWGMYTDQASRDVVFADNIVTNTTAAGIHQHYGINNTFTNNVLALTNVHHLDGVVRSSQSSGKCTFPASGAMSGCSSFDFSKNILLAGDDTAPYLYATVVAGYDNMTFEDNTYFTASGNPMAPRFPHNTTFARWQAAGKDGGSGIDNPLFANATAKNFTVQPNSPALPRGFVNIDVSVIGPQTPVGPENLVVPPVDVPEVMRPFVRQ